MRRTGDEFKGEKWVDTPVSPQRFEAASSYVQSAIRSIILANGAAAVSLLTFLGSMLEKMPDPEVTIDAMKYPMKLFVFGVMLGVATAGFAYFTQLKSSLRPLLWWGGTISGLSGVLAFGYGAWSALEALAVSVAGR